MSILAGHCVQMGHIEDSSVFKALGCERCFNTGYKGRIGIFEIMVLTERLKSLILKTFDSNRIKNEAAKQKMASLRQDGIEKVPELFQLLEPFLGCSTPRAEIAALGRPLQS